MNIFRRIWLAFFMLASAAVDSRVSMAQIPASRSFSGVVTSEDRKPLEGVLITLRYISGERSIVTNENGQFRCPVPVGSFSVHLEGKNLLSRDVVFHAGEATDGVPITLKYFMPPMHDSVVIVADPIEPAIDRRNDNVYKNTLFGRDDQLLFTLDAGINAGQHEGGGKSLEIRRFGFNLDHGGVNGGLKVLVDDVQQNQGSQGHGQGYLGQLKSLSSELVEDVDILNGPFSAEYGDFSGLGVVHIRLKESLPDQFTLRLQGGAFGSHRTFLGYSPSFEKADAFLAYEGSRTDGPFQSP